MTYTEIQDRLNKCEVALNQLKNGAPKTMPKEQVASSINKLQMLKEQLGSKLKGIAEQEMGDDGYVATDDEDRAEDLAKKGVNVKLTKEQEEGVQFSQQETAIITKEVGKVLLDALREVGDEVDSMKGRNIQPNNFNIYVKYKSDFEDEFNFIIQDNVIILVDQNTSTELGEVGAKPSGEPIVHDTIIKSNLIKHFRSINEQEYAKDIEVQADEEEEYEKLKQAGNLSEEVNDRQRYLRMMDMYKTASGADRDRLRPQVLKAAKKIGLDLDLSGLFENKQINKPTQKQVAHFFQDTEQEAHYLNNKPVDKWDDYDASNWNSKVNKAKNQNMDEDTDIGHTDDEPGMLKSSALETATYAAKLYKKLNAYDKMDGEIDFPHWWQKKMILARDYVSAAFHYLDSEEKQPAIDQLALEGKAINEQKEYEVEYWVNTPDGYDNNYVTVKALSSEEAIEKAKQQVTPRAKDFKIYKTLGEKKETTKGIPAKEEEKFHKKLDTLVHNTFGKREEELEENINPEVTKLVNRFIGGLAKRYDYDTQSAVNAIMTVLKSQSWQGVNEDHSKDPNDKYVVRPCKNKKEPWAVWEGEKRVKGFAEKKDAKAFADKKNKEQGLNEQKSTCCHKCGRKHVKGTECKTPYLKGKDSCKYK